MKFNKERDKDCYLYISNGEIMEEDKVDVGIKTMSQESNIKPKEKDLYDKLSEYTDKLPKKKVFNRILIGVISLVCICLFFSIAKIMKSTSTLNDLTSNPQKIEEVYLVANTIENSNKYILDYYNTINNLIVNNRSDLNGQVSSIKNMITTDLNDIKTLYSHINLKSLESSINILENRFNNLLSLCNSLTISHSSNKSEIYNKYVKTEIELLSNQISDITKIFDSFYIEYSIDKNNSIIFKK